MNKEFARKVVAYIEDSNNTLEKYASEIQRLSRENAALKSNQFNQGEFREKLAASIKVLTDEGRIPTEYSNAVFESMKDSPEKVAEFLCKINDVPSTMGQASDEFRSSTDPIVDFAFG